MLGCHGLVDLFLYCVLCVLIQWFLFLFLLLFVFLGRAGGALSFMCLRVSLSSVCYCLVCSV